ncbi:MAG: biotin--[acetyl-CoA-carboxylase] ligase [Candidatus Methylopumilus sp.]|nr:biotin--[acetyl-CoA-carboxylase] ligase [Candidatus Methylopumilus sp.]
MQNDLVFEVLDVLSDGKFHSGESIGEQFDVSRVSIWNAIKKAEEFGVEIYSVRGRGYKLIQPITLLKKPIIEQMMGEIHHWFNLEIFDVIDSTNSYLMEKASLGHPHASVAATHIQMKGRGRRGRSWQSALGESLTFSLLWRFNGGAATLSGLSLAVGVALIRSFHRFGVISAQLKWPNDVLVKDEVQYKKLAGILIELQGDMEGQSSAVIGIGINLKLSKKSLNHIDQPAIDLKSVSVEEVDPNELLGQILKDLADILGQFNSSKFTSLKEEWMSYHAYQDQTVTLSLGDGRSSTGIARGVTEDGALMVENSSQGIEIFSSGEITLRKI